MSKDKHQGWMLLFGDLLQAALQLGLLSGTLLAAALGKVLLAILLGSIALGVFLRFKRGRK
ncbi:MAG: hypothetical protein U1F55_10500 [Chitinivorax sp.]